MKKKIKVLGVDNGHWERDGKPWEYYDILCKYYAVEISPEPDFLFYSVWGNEFLKYKNCVRIFHTGENVRPDFNLCDYAIGYDRMEFGERYIRRPSLAKRMPLESGRNYAKRKFCNFIYSNDQVGVGAKARVDFCKFLSSYKHIDCPGRVLNNMTGAISGRNQDFIKGKYDFLPNYKFTIAWENDFYPGYSTEKIVNPLECNSVPIYMGDPDICLDYNRKALINCNDFNTWDEILEYVKFLDENDAAYMEMLAQPPMNPDYRLPDIDAFLINIIENGKRYVNEQVEKLVLTPLAFYDYIIESVKTYIGGKTPHNEKHKALAIFDEYRYKNYFNKSIYFANSILPLLKNDSREWVKTEALAGFLGNGAIGEKKFGVHQLEMIKSISARLDAGSKHAGVQYNNNPDDYSRYLCAMGLLWPYDVSGRVKIRIGGAGDDGCVMLQENEAGTALTLGHKGKGGWECALAAKGWHVWQYDNIFDAPGAPHPNIRFHKLPPGEIFGTGHNTLPAMLRQMGDDKRIIARIDIKGSELELFENAAKADLERIDQFFVVFYGLSRPETLLRFLKILVKIHTTHLPVHVHLHNNYGKILAFQSFLFADLVEVTFARRDLGVFTPSKECYPSPLDSPNIPDLPEIYIGKFKDATCLSEPISLKKTAR